MKKSAIMLLGFAGIAAGMLAAGAGKAQAYGPGCGQALRPAPSGRAVPVRAMRQQQERMRTIWENCDYDAWKQRMGDRPITEKITRENFSDFCQLHSAVLEGERKEAAEIRQELELPQPKPFWDRFSLPLPWRW